MTNKKGLEFKDFMETKEEKEKKAQKKVKEFFSTLEFIAKKQACNNCPEFEAKEVARVFESIKKNQVDEKGENHDK